MPCPLCVAAVKGANLDRHLARTHAGDEAPPHPSRWRGAERVGSRRLLVLGLLVGTASVGGTRNAGGQPGRSRKGAGAGGVAGAMKTQRTASSSTSKIRLAFGGIGFAAVAVIIWSAVAWGAPLFPGRLRVDERGALLRHSFGLGRRRLDVIDRLVLGSAWESRPTGSSGSDDSYESVDVRVGSYLQLRSGRRSITVHCRTAGSVRTTWSGWEQGKRRKRLDITVDRTAFVALQLALWERDLLVPRA